MHDGLRDKRTTTLSAINYFAIETVYDSPPVIDSQARYWLKKSRFMPKLGGPRRNIATEN